MREIVNYIYTITDPSSQSVIYVGRTADPAVRFRTHMSKNKSKISFEIQKLKSKNIVPIFTIIEQCPYLKASEREKYWINHFCSNGNFLLNVERKKKGISYEVKFKEGVEISDWVKKSFE